MMGDPVALYATEKTTPEQLDALREKHNLDAPMHERYVSYLNSLLHGDLGYSKQANLPVSEAIQIKFMATLELSLIAFMLAVIFSIPLGIFASTKHNKWQDHALRFFSLIGSAVPLFWLALLLKYGVAYKMDLLPLGQRIDYYLWDIESPIEQYTGSAILDSILNFSPVHFWDALSHLILPAFTLTFASLAGLLRFMRGSMLDVLDQDFVRTAKAKGLSNRKVVYDHAARNALIPTVTILGMGFAGLLNGSVLTETIWQWPGLGQWAVAAMRNLDTAAILGLTLFSGILTIIANLVVDILYAYLDPRIELSGYPGPIEWIVVILSVTMLFFTWLSVDLGLTIGGIVLIVASLLLIYALFKYITSDDFEPPAVMNASFYLGVLFLVLEWFVRGVDRSSFMYPLGLLLLGTALVLYLNDLRKLDLSFSMNDFKAELNPRLDEFKRAAYQLKKNPLALIGLCMIFTIFLVAIFAPFLAPPEEGQRDPHRMEEHFEYNFDLQAPGENGYILGSTNAGYDIYYGLVWGTQIAIKVGFIVVSLGTLIAVTLGVISGYYGGRVDEVIMRVTDVFLAIPGLVLALAVVAVLNTPSLEHLMYALIVVWWPGFTRIVRGQALTVRNLPYVEAAKAAGASDFRIIFKHVLPNCMTPVIISATLDIGSVVLVFAGLGFLGFGGTPDLAEWGLLVGFGQSHLTDGYWWAFFFPGLAISFWALAFYLFGDGLRDILDPRKRD